MERKKINRRNFQKDEKGKKKKSCSGHSHTHTQKKFTCSCSPKKKSRNGREPPPSPPSPLTFPQQDSQISEFLWNVILKLCVLGRERERATLLCLVFLSLIVAAPDQTAVTANVLLFLTPLSCYKLSSQACFVCHTCQLFFLILLCYISYYMLY